MIWNAPAFTVTALEHAFMSLEAFVLIVGLVALYILLDD